MLLRIIGETVDSLRTIGKNGNAAVLFQITDKLYGQLGTITDQILTLIQDDMFKFLEVIDQLAIFFL